MNRKHFEPDEKHAYLGDGLYAHYDEAFIWLSCDRADGAHTVALDPEVFEALLRYSKTHDWLADWNWKGMEG